MVQKKNGTWWSCLLPITQGVGSIHTAGGHQGREGYLKSNQALTIKGWREDPSLGPTHTHTVPTFKQMSSFFAGMEIISSFAALIGRVLPKWRLECFRVCTVPQAYLGQSCFGRRPWAQLEHTFSGGRVPEHSAGAGVQGCRSMYTLCQMHSKNAKEKIPLSLRGSSTVEFPRNNLSELFCLFTCN